MSDEFCERFLQDPESQEVLGWLKGGSDEDFRSLGELATTEESIALAMEVYDAGALEVFAVEIDKYPEGQNTGKLIVKLPQGAEPRSRVLAWCGKIAEEQGFEPEPDTDQLYVFVMLD